MKFNIDTDWLSFVLGGACHADFYGKLYGFSLFVGPFAFTIERR